MLIVLSGLQMPDLLFQRLAPRQAFGALLGRSLHVFIGNDSYVIFAVFAISVRVCTEWSSIVRGKYFLICCELGDLGGKTSVQTVVDDSPLWRFFLESCTVGIFAKMDKLLEIHKLYVFFHFDRLNSFHCTDRLLNELFVVQLEFYFIAYCEMVHME